jgi:hypothetical protein
MMHSILTFLSGRQFGDRRLRRWVYDVESPVRLALLILLLSLGAITPAVAQDDETSRSSLKGLNGVKVVVEGLKPLEEQAGLTVADLQTDVELKLRLAGIPVLTASAEAPGAPFLYVRVTVVSRTTNNVWPYVLGAQLNQTVRLDRSPTTIVSGVTTWGVARVGAADPSTIRGRVRDSAKDLIDQFVNAYLAANPKQ